MAVGSEASSAAVRALAVLLLLLAAPSVASARSVVVLVSEQAPDGADLRATAIEALAERGVRLVRTPDGEICDADPVPCAAELAARAGADATLRVDVVEGEPPQVLVRLVPAEGDPVEERSDVTDGDVAGAVYVTVGRALDIAPPSSAGFLLVRTDPPDARVEVDGEEVGRSPLRVTLAPGPHDVRVRHPEGSAEGTVEIVAGRELAYEPELGEASEPGEGSRPERPAQTRSEPSPFNYLIGGGLALAGVITLISPLSTLAREGQCEEEIEEVGCVEMVRFGAQSGVLLGIGLAALIAAVIFDVAAPIRVDVAVDPQSAMVGVRGRF